jgi:hypothetical protein
MEKDIDRAIRYYRRSASQSHPGGLYNFGRCLEYGKGIPQDFIRAAKFYRLAAELNDPAAENSFGICLERGIGVASNYALATRYYQRSAAHGDPDGANNLGFCLEHGRGTRVDIEAAASCYKFARDHGHPEGEINYRRCTRILGRWEVPDRSSTLSDRASADTDWLNLFTADLGDSDNSDELLLSIERLKSEMAGPPDRPIVKLPKEWKRNLLSRPAIRPPVIPKKLNHPLIVSGSQELNGSLGSHLSDALDSEFCQLRGATRIARIVTGIALAMKFVHSQGIVYRKLSPESILLDWDWNVNLSDFSSLYKIRC